MPENGFFLAGYKMKNPLHFPRFFSPGSQIIVACDCSEIAGLEMIWEKNYFENKEESVCVYVASARWVLFVFSFATLVILVDGLSSPILILSFDFPRLYYRQRLKCNDVLPIISGKSLSEYTMYILNFYSTDDSWIISLTTL